MQLWNTNNQNKCYKKIETKKNRLKKTGQVTSWENYSGKSLICRKFFVADQRVQLHAQ